MTNDIKAQLEMLASGSEKKAAELLKSAKQTFASIDDQVRNVRDNGEFNPGATAREQIDALSCASRFLTAYAADAQAKLDEARRQFELAQTFRDVISQAD